MSRDNLFVGSISPQVARTNQEAMKFMVDKCGRHLRSIPTGELEHGGAWVDWILKRIANYQCIQVIKSNKFHERGYLGAPVYRIRPGTSLLDELDLGYVQRVREMWDTFQELRHPGQKFQLNVISPYDLSWFGFAGSRKAFESIVEATSYEVKTVVDEFGAENVVVQVESPLSNIFANAPGSSDARITRLALRHKEVVDSWPRELERGFHLCDGRLHEKAVGTHRMYRMTSTARIGVELAGAMNLSYIHWPVVVGTASPPLPESKYYDGLEVFRLLPDTVRLYAGMVHVGDPLAQQARLLGSIEGRIHRLVGVAATCGLAGKTAEETGLIVNYMSQLTNA